MGPGRPKKRIAPRFIVFNSNGIIKCYHLDRHGTAKEIGQAPLNPVGTNKALNCPRLMESVAQPHNTGLKLMNIADFESSIEMLMPLMDWDSANMVFESSVGENPLWSLEGTAQHGRSGDGGLQL